MARLLFRLNGVPEDEADDVRRLLADHDIEWHETHAGLLGISIAAIWLTDASEYDRARALLDEYEAERAERVRAEYAARSARGWPRILLDSIGAHPIRILLSILGLLVVLYLSTIPFLGFGS